MVGGHVFWCQVKVLGPWIPVQISPAMGTASLTEVQPQDSLQCPAACACPAPPAATAAEVRIGLVCKLKNITTDQTN